MKSKKRDFEIVFERKNKNTAWVKLKHPPQKQFIADIVNKFENDSQYGALFLIGSNDFELSTFVRAHCKEQSERYLECALDLSLNFKELLGLSPNKIKLCYLDWDSPIIQDQDFLNLLFNIVAKDTSEVEESLSHEGLSNQKIIFIIEGDHPATIPSLLSEVLNRSQYYIWRKTAYHSQDRDENTS